MMSKAIVVAIFDIFDMIYQIFPSSSHKDYIMLRPPLLEALSLKGKYDDHISQK